MPIANGGVVYKGGEVLLTVVTSLTPYGGTPVVQDLVSNPTLSIITPAGTTITPTVSLHPATGTYQYLYQNLPAPGTYSLRWQGTFASGDVMATEDSFPVQPSKF